MASARPLRVYTLLDFSLAGCSVLEQHKGLSCSAGLSSYKNTKVAAAAAAGFLERGLFVENVKFLKEAERFCYDSVNRLRQLGEFVDVRWLDWQQR
ncbi:hypothetical protein NQZ68_033999 [Dissostichus eleginoides]|nr:hypothetical protein NQZ68_033999 [Dissostichus eleginoides]